MADHSAEPEKPGSGPDLSALYRAADLYPGMTLGCLKTFVHAYKDGGRSTMVEMAASLGVAYTTFARHTDTLGVIGSRSIRTVYGLFEKAEHPGNRRAIVIIPTQRGHDLARAMGLQFQPGVTPDLPDETPEARVVTPGMGRGRF